MRKRVVFVEDDDVIRENYTELLTEEGFEVEAFRDRYAALARVKQSAPDLALLDISLDQERDAGFQLCADLRRLYPRLPIIFLTSHDAEVDKISGIRLGADDYLTKDVSLDYLIVRMEALLRRFEALGGGAAKSAASDGQFVAGALVIDRQQMLASWRGRKLDLTLTQLWIVQDLAANPGQVRRYEQLMKAANIVVEPNTITAHIKTIRERFRAIDPEFDGIKSERALGYRWVES